MTFTAQNYTVTVENGALQKAGELFDLNRKVLVVTDDGVPAIYAQTVLARAKEGFLVCLPQGEATKNLGSWQKLLSCMLEHGFTRSDCVVAVGGGVMGDLAGFAASAYMRGIDFYNVPTTLLSQVDSSIGGKTAVDFQGVKNIVGAFYPPKGVIVDPMTLETLNDRQMRAGWAEIIKMAATSDEALFQKIEQTGALRRDLPEIIYRSLCIKRDVVDQDPNEQGLRKVLNFGHTVGHAIESAMQGAWLHGECVSVGMLPLCGERERLKQLLVRFGLPVQAQCDPAVLRTYLLHDKKMKDGCISVVYVNKIGSFAFRLMTPEALLEVT